MLFNCDNDFPFVRVPLKYEIIFLLMNIPYYGGTKDKRLYVRSIITSKVKS